MIMESWLIWLIAAAICLAIEVLSQSMWALCLSVGCLFAMLASFMGLDSLGQVMVLAAGVVASYLLLIPLLKRIRTRFNALHGREARTGMEALLGRKAIVTEPILPGHLGRARIDGDNWQVRAPGVSTVIPYGAEVSVTSYDSIILDVAI